MRLPLLVPLLAGLALAGQAAAAASQPASVCPQLRRVPIALVARLPAPIREATGPMANPGGRWNAGDAIGPGQTHLPFRRMIAAGDMGSMRWLLVYEQGGFARFNVVQVWSLKPDGTADKLVEASAGDVKIACEQAAAKLS
jgi:hypothetical protein